MGLGILELVIGCIETFFKFIHLKFLRKEKVSFSKILNSNDDKNRVYYFLAFIFLILLFYLITIILY
jgi:hypothetical protein